MTAKLRSTHLGQFRMLLLLVLVGSIVVASWTLTRADSAAQQAAVLDDFLSSIARRGGASIDQQIASLQERRRVAPEDWRTHSLLGLAFLQKARETGNPTYYQQADAVLQTAFTLNPSDYTALSALGELALARHQFRAALQWGEQARRINPDRTYAYGVIADAQIELGMYEAAVASLQTMVDLQPGPSAYTRISYIRELHGDLNGATTMMQQAVDGGSPHAENAAWTRTQLAHLHFKQGDLDQAEIEYRRTLSKRPDYVYALAGLGQVYAARGQTTEAIQSLTQARDIRPLPEILILLGDLYLVTDQPAAAQQQYDLVRVIQQVQQANGVDIDLEFILFEADHGGDPAATVRQARRVYTQRPSVHAADVLAWALYQTGDYQAAGDYAAQALRLGTADALILFHAGMIVYQLGAEDQARIYLEQALNTNPYFSLRYSDQARQVLAVLPEK